MTHADTQKSVVSHTHKEISVFWLNFIAVKQQETYQMVALLAENEKSNNIPGKILHPYV